VERGRCLLASQVWCGVSTRSTLLVGAEKRRGRNRGGHRKADWLSDGLLKVATLEPDRAARALYEQSGGCAHWGRPFGAPPAGRGSRGVPLLGTSAVGVAWGHELVAGCGRARRRLRAGRLAVPG
jgi:hypothetical protein